MGAHMLRSFFVSIALAAVFAGSSAQAQQTAGGPGHAAAIVSDDPMPRVLILGGDAASGASTEMLQWLPDAMDPVPAVLMTTPRTRHTATMVQAPWTAKVVVIGGNDG